MSDVDICVDAKVLRIHGRAEAHVNVISHKHEKPCVHGKECEHHGNHGGDNAEHCNTTTTTPSHTTTTEHHGTTTSTTVDSTSTTQHPTDNTSTTATVGTTPTTADNSLAHTGFAAEPFTGLAFFFIAFGLLIKKARKMV